MKFNANETKRQNLRRRFAHSPLARYPQNTFRNAIIVRANDKRKRKMKHQKNENRTPPGTARAFGVGAVESSLAARACAIAVILFRDFGFDFKMLPKRFFVNLLVSSAKRNANQRTALIDKHARNVLTTVVSVARQ